MTHLEQFCPLLPVPSLASVLDCLVQESSELSFWQVVYSDFLSHLNERIQTRNERE